uniref:DC2-related axonemal dynein intermediate chain 4 n=1 Tax=Callorhinchus milii TaxID=7868 RepID=V9KNH7_CALMI|eukprot:gi/632987423/ref/XP_007910777.1/ PREDICTED: coiled-coil domain-containing protein 151 [Callorhinchus milii]
MLGRLDRRPAARPNPKISSLAGKLTERLKGPVQEQIWELQKKIQLLEGDKKAYFESSQWTIKKNKETILYLRNNNMKLHKELTDMLAGEKVVEEAFQDRDDETILLRSKNGKEAVEVIDQIVCNKVKQLNILKYETELRKKRVSELELTHNQYLQETAYQQRMRMTTTQESKMLRSLENRLEKTHLKCHEAKHIMRIYQELKSHLQEESLTFQNQLDALEAEILRLQHELKELQDMNSNAQLSRDAAKAELHEHEEVKHRERRERERILVEYNKLADEKKVQAERAERRALRTLEHHEDIRFEPTAPSETRIDRKFSALSEAFNWIKEVTAVSSVEEVVKRVVMQGDTQKQLEEMKEGNIRQLSLLREEKKKLVTQLEELKYSQNNNLSSGRQMLKELDSHVKQEKERQENELERLTYIIHIMMLVKAGVEHLSNKLRHIQMPKSYPAKAELPFTADAYVLDALELTEDKLLKILDDLKGINLDEVLQQIQEEEYHSTIEGKLPSFNLRIQMPTTQKFELFDDYEDSADDDDDVVTRAMLKKQSQQIVDWKTKRRSRPRKRRGKH